MYGNNKLCQIKHSGREERVAQAGIYPASSLSCENIPLSLRPHKGIDGGSLGIYTKSQATFKNKGVERLHNFLLQDQACKLLPKHRVCNCLKKRIDKTKDRLVKYNVDRKKAHWSNVQRCGCLWIDPVCAKQITEGRRSELSSAIDRWKKEFLGGCLLLTLTFSHSLNMPLTASLLGLRDAYARFVGHRRVKEIFKAIGVENKIKGLEILWGQNGWHPHNHILLLTKYTVLGFESYRDELARLWINSCLKAGLRSPSMEHGLDIRDGSHAEEYISKYGLPDQNKWGLPEEITKGHMKKGRNGGFTPFDLLQLSIEDKPLYGGKLPSKLFQEFAFSIKGSSQLVWGRGLKKLLCIEEKTDQELAEETEKNAIELTSVANYGFTLLTIFQKRHVFLDCVARDYEQNDGFSSANALLDELHFKYLEIQQSKQLE